MLGGLRCTFARSTRQRAGRPQQKRNPLGGSDHFLVNMATTTWGIAGAILVSVGGGGAIVFALSSWLGKVWATRIADAERARFARELEGYKSELQQLLEDRRDALARKRDIYGRVVASMRVFLAGGRPASDADKQEFLLGFDQAAL